MESRPLGSEMNMRSPSTVTDESRKERARVGQHALYRLRCRVRQQMQRKLGRFVDAYRPMVAAAGIAGLIGACTAEQAIADAKLRFRSIRANQLSLTDFHVSPTIGMPAEGLFKRTEMCALGECDAFMSHSWHDPVGPKWSALQHWRDTFLFRHGREPRIWFDKACINQSDIKADLLGLPLFLSGCSELLIFVGPTYLSRLWCIVELFTFVHMGGDVNRICVLRVIRESHKEQDEKAIENSIRDFDAEQCDCFSDDDKIQMLGIILAAFGDMASFNTALRALIHKVGFASVNSCPDGES